MNKRPFVLALAILLLTASLAFGASNATTATVSGTTVSGMLSTLLVRGIDS